MINYVYIIYVHEYTRYTHFFLRLEELTLIQLKSLEASQSFGLSRFPQFATGRFR